jgi:hypothetical protein
VELDRFVQRVDSKVAKERPEWKTGDTLESGSCCLGVNSRGFSAVVAATAVAVATNVTVVMSLLSNVFRGLLLMSQIG